jgi:hypothetical protein
MEILWKKLALEGICPDCSQPMPRKTQEEIDEWVVDLGEDAPMSCETCEVNVLVDAGWDVAWYDKYMPGFLDSEDKRDHVNSLVMARDECRKRRQMWWDKKITREQMLLAQKEIRAIIELPSLGE